MDNCIVIKDISLNFLLLDVNSLSISMKYINWHKLSKNDNESKKCINILSNWEKYWIYENAIYGSRTRVYG